MRYIITAIFVVFALTSCKQDTNSGGEGPESDIVKTNKWIYSMMLEHYLYSDRTKVVTPNYNLDSEHFFYSLLSSSTEDNDGKHSAGDSYFYSYMEQQVGTKSIDVTNSYGFDYVLYNDYTARVIYVVKGTVAERSGLRRGDWIYAIDGKINDQTNISKLDKGTGAKLLVERFDNNGITQPRVEITLGASGPIENSPVFLAMIHTAPTGNVGYLVYNSFETGPGGFADKKYDTQLIEVFKQFKSYRVQEMILDMRYNPGGYITSAALLGSMLVPQSALGDIFAITQSRSKEESIFRMQSQVEASQSNLNLNRIYILTSEWTASASELVINGLKPYMSEENIVLIGMRTEGKNVGSYSIPLNGSFKYGLRLQPITVNVMNKMRKSDYKDGFRPTFKVDEFGDFGQWYELGDPREPLLKSALSNIIYGSFTAKSSSTPNVRSLSVGRTPLPNSSSHLVRVRGSMIN